MCHIVPPNVRPALYAVMVSPFSGGENDEGVGSYGCEYFSDRTALK
jgi:hypothetical protein